MHWSLWNCWRVDLSVRGETKTISVKETLMTTWCRCWSCFECSSSFSWVCTPAAGYKSGATSASVLCNRPWDTSVGAVGGLREGQTDGHRETLLLADIRQESEWAAWMVRTNNIIHSSFLVNKAHIPCWCSRLSHSKTHTQNSVDLFFVFIYSALWSFFEAGLNSLADWWRGAVRSSISAPLQWTSRVQMAHARSCKQRVEMGAAAECKWQK